MDSSQTTAPTTTQRSPLKDEIDETDSVEQVKKDSERRVSEMTPPTCASSVRDISQEREIESFEKKMEDLILPRKLKLKPNVSPGWIPELRGKLKGKIKTLQM